MGLTFGDITYISDPSAISRGIVLYYSVNASASNSTSLTNGNWQYESAPFYRTGANTFASMVESNGQFSINPSLLGG